MSWLSKRHPIEADPAYTHMVGRLVGATGMLTSYMMLHGDDPAKGMAQRVDELLAFFIEDYSPVVALPRSEADTQIIPPPYKQKRADTSVAD